MSVSQFNIEQTMTNAVKEKAPKVDFLGQPFEVGQRVVFMPPGYKEFSWGYVKKITPLTVRIAYSGNTQQECNRLQQGVIILTKEQATSLAFKRLAGI